LLLAALLIIFIPRALFSDGPNGWYHGVKVTLKSGEVLRGYMPWSDNGWWYNDLNDLRCPYKYWPCDSLPAYVKGFWGRALVPKEQCRECNEPGNKGRVFKLWLDYFNFRADHSFQGLDREKGQVIELCQLVVAGPPLGLVAIDEATKRIVFSDVRRLELDPKLTRDVDWCAVPVASRTLVERLAKGKPDDVVYVFDEAGFLLLSFGEARSLLEYMELAVLSENANEFQINGHSIKIDQRSALDLKEGQKTDLSAAWKERLRALAEKVSMESKDPATRNLRLKELQVMNESFDKTRSFGAGLYGIAVDRCYD
jgi:hypothetical protein